MATPLQITPGPWKAVDLRKLNGQIRIFANAAHNAGHIANVVGSNRNCEGDANVILAAPAMLKAIREAIVLLNGMWAANENPAYISGRVIGKLQHVIETFEP